MIDLIPFAEFEQEMAGKEKKRQQLVVTSSPSLEGSQPQQPQQPTLDTWDSQPFLFSGITFQMILKSSMERLFVRGGYCRSCERSTTIQHHEKVSCR